MVSLDTGLGDGLWRRQACPGLIWWTRVGRALGVMFGALWVLCVLTTALKQMALLRLLSKVGELRKVHLLGSSYRESLAEV